MLLWKLLLVFMVFKQSTAQVCNQTRIIVRDIPETYQYTYYEAYEDSGCLIWCTKSRLAVNVGTRQVKKNVNEIISACCDGYIEDISYKGDGIKCTPLCNPPCDNGYCKSPNECACQAGYAKDPNDVLKRCVPLCLEGCSTPDCLSTCSEYDDYEASETDLCNGTCINGTCVAPSVCHCDPGYRRLLDVCEPICSACNHGRCVAPGLCKCDFGWREECGSCQPICSGCEHGQCKAPGQCECDPGYKALNAKCEPHCTNCNNGNCVAPDICACDPGWYMNEDNSECMAHCDVVCGNGTCVAPDKCECYSGYQQRAPQEEDERWNSEEPQCVPICNNCDKLCVAPDICKCEAQYETVYTTVDGSDCDCFDCSDASRKCERITCRIKSNDTNEEETEGEPDLVTATTNNLEEVIPLGYTNTTHMGDIKKSKNDKIASCTNLKAAELTYHWIYIAIIIIEMLVIIIMLVILKKKHLLDRLKIKKFVPQDKPNSEVSVHYTSSVVCSKLKETSETGKS